MPLPAAEATASEISKVRARIIPDRWQKGDFDAFSPALDRLLQSNPEDADAWALRSIINSLQVLRLIDPGTKPLEAGKAAAERALRLAPDLPIGHLALGMHLTANVSRGGDPRASREPLDRAVAALPPDALTRYAELVAFWLGYDFENTRRCASAWLEAEPTAQYPAWIMTSMSVTLRRGADVEKWAARSFRDNDVTSVRALCNLIDANYFLRADLVAARSVMARVPLGARAMTRVVYWQWLLAMSEQQWDEALQILAQVPGAMLLDVAYNGPKALLVGMAHQRAGRTDAAALQFREAERLVREILTGDPDNEALRAVLAVTLASAGRADEARRELALVEPLVRGRAPNVYRPRLIVSLAQTYGALGDMKAMAFWLRKLFAEPSSVPLTPASLRLDPRFNVAIDAPEIQALLKEFAPLDQPAKKDPDGNGETTAVAPSVDQKSVAVLAFANLSDEKGNEYFSDGISEELLNVLAKIPKLKVSARTSSFHFKGKDTPIPEIARQLGVAYIVEGSVRRAGDRVRITAQLIKASDGFHVWSDTFTRELKDIFAVQDEIAGLIAGQLQLKLGSSVEGRKTVNPEAYRLVLEGHHFWLQRTGADLVRAETLFQQALAIAPDFARAHAGQAGVWMIRDWYRIVSGFPSDPDEHARSKAAAERAISVDPTLAEPYAILGVLLFNEEKVTEAAQAFQTALRLNPNYSFGHHWYSHMLMASGQLDAALAEMNRAVQLDPLSFVTLLISSMWHGFAGRYDEALALSDRAVQFGPEFFVPLLAERAQVLQAVGRTGEAVALARRVAANWDPQTRWWADPTAIHMLRRAGLTQEAKDYANRLLTTVPADYKLRSFVSVALGQNDEALEQLSRLGAPSSTLGALFYSSLWDEVRGDPRFMQVITGLGMGKAYETARAARAHLSAETQAKP